MKNNEIKFREFFVNECSIINELHIKYYQNNMSIAVRTRCCRRQHLLEQFAERLVKCVGANENGLQRNVIK